MSPNMDEGNMEFIKAGAACFASFLLWGSVPLISYVALVPAGFSDQSLFGISCGLTGLMLFILGALKSKFTLLTWYASGLEVLIVGGSCAAAAYLIGWGTQAMLVAMNFEIAESTNHACNLTLS